MTNATLKQGLSAVARGAAALPGVGPGDIARINNHVDGISAKLDWTKGMDNTGLPEQFTRLNPGSGGGKGASGGSGALVGLLTGLAPVLFGGPGAGAASWLEDVGITGQEKRLDDEQLEHSDCLEILCTQTQQCVDSVDEIDATAQQGVEEIIDLLLMLISVLRGHPAVRVGTMALAPIIDGLHTIEQTVDNRNESIGQCYEKLRELCDDAGSRQPPEPKDYAGSGDGETNGSGGGQGSAQAPSLEAPAAVAPQEGAPASPDSSPQLVDLPTTPSSFQGGASIDLGAGGALHVNVDLNVNVNGSIDLGVPPLPDVPPVGPAGECVVDQFLAGVENFRQQVEMALPTLECPPDELAAGPAPEPEPESAPAFPPDQPEPSKPAPDQPVPEYSPPFESMPEKPIPEQPVPEKPIPDQPVPPKPGGEAAVAPAAVDAAGSSAAGQDGSERAADDQSGGQDEPQRTRKTRTW